MFAQVTNLVDSQLPDTDVLMSTVRTKAERELPLHAQTSPCENHSGYPPENTVKKLTAKSDRATTSNPSKLYPAGMGKTPCTVEKIIARKKTIVLSINLGIGADIR